MIFHNRRIMAAAHRRPFVGAPAGFVGVGDVVSGWMAWGGMRAFSAATAATPTNAVELNYADDVAIVYATQADGTINLAASVTNGLSHAQNLINHGSPAIVKTWFDQTGNGRHLNSGGTLRPPFTTGVIGSFPGITFASGNGMSTNPVGITQSQPLSLSVVFKPTSSVTNSIVFGSISPNLDYLGYANTPPDEVYMHAGGPAGERIATAFNSFHAVNAVFNSTSSHLYVDGVDTAAGISIGTDNIAGFMQISDNSTPLIGIMMEWGLFNGSLLSSFSSLNSNQHSAYGF